MDEWDAIHRLRVGFQRSIRRMSGELSGDRPKAVMLIHATGLVHCRTES